jgi:hypothetical protein
VGKRYTREEINQIQVLTEEGLTSNEIAIQLGRPDAGARAFWGFGVLCARTWIDAYVKRERGARAE